MSPFCAKSCFFKITMSPSKMPSSIIDCPFTLRAKNSPGSLVRLKGTESISLSSIASMGCPAVMTPASGIISRASSGTSLTFSGIAASNSMISMERASFSEMVTNPRFSRFFTCWKTVATEERSKCEAISR